MGMDLNNINLEDYNYILPESSIAQYPLSKRDHSKLLISKNGEISSDIFSGISKYLQNKSLLVLNDTKVIQARLLFKKESGSEIEIFCLEPVLPTNDFQLAFATNSGVVWQCLVGNNKKWKQGKLFLKRDSYTLSAERLSTIGDTFQVKFEWEPKELTFASIIEIFGRTPLPPYINRVSEESDTKRYQTVYAHFEGSVAAPTAGLHFTDEVFCSLKEKNIDTAFITLHVGAGTFKPVSSQNIKDHVMHNEFFTIEKSFIRKLLDNTNPVVAVGTTSVRTLESLYWIGKRILEKRNQVSCIDQWEPYNPSVVEPSPRDSLQAIIDYCELKNLNQINGSTSLIIVPGYRYRIVNEMITNFHQPRSTLLLLVSAFVGDTWIKAYEYAMKNKFRFLSYGDVCYFKP